MERRALRVLVPRGPAPCPANVQVYGTVEVRAVLFAGLLWCAAPGGAAAQGEPRASDVEAGGERERRAADEEPERRLEWTFPEMHPIEYAVGFGGQVALPIVRWLTDEPNRIRWRESNWLDDGVQGAIGNNAPDTHLWAELLSDITWYSNTAWPFIDAIVVAWLLDGNLHVGWQLFAIAASATALDGFVTLSLIHLTGRHRPYTRYCLERGGSDDECNADNAKSFPSGHTAGSFTGAGLTCSAHLALPLYGGGAHDTAACVSALVLATGTGVFRIVSDKHYVIDVVAGAAIGLAFGWALPWLLHYRLDESEEDVDVPADAERQGAPRSGVMLVPFGDANGALGLGLAGWF